MSMAGHPLLDRWMAAVQAQDLGSIAELYHDEATFDGLAEAYRGRHEILDGLQAHHRVLRRVGTARVDRVDGDGDVCFRTDVHGLFGDRSYLHAWHVRDGRILAHRVESA